MNVKLYSLNAEYSDCRSIAPTVGRMDSPDASSIKERPSGDYDTITIRRIQKPVAGTASTERVMALRGQVASGAYRTDARQIAEGLLAYGLHAQ